VAHDRSRDGEEPSYFIIIAEFLGQLFDYQFLKMGSGP
jgi:hypothetical protein